MTLDELIIVEQELRQKIERLTKKADKIKKQITDRIAPYIPQQQTITIVERPPNYPYIPRDFLKTWEKELEKPYTIGDIPGTYYC